MGDEGERLGQGARFLEIGGCGQGKGGLRVDPALRLGKLKVFRMLHGVIDAFPIPLCGHMIHI